MELLKNWIKQVSKIFPDLKEVYLFGSRVSGEINKNSDYDLIFVFNNDKKYLIKSSDGFYDINAEKIYNLLEEKNLNYYTPNKKMLFHIFLKLDFERVTHSTIGDKYSGTKLIFKLK